MPAKTPWPLALAWLAWAGPALPAPLTCPDPTFTVTADDPVIATRACTAAGHAQSTLGTCGVTIDRPVAIEIRDTLSTDNCLGLYHCGEDRIEVLTPSALSHHVKDGPFAALDRAAYWASIIVHEIAHAAYDTVKCPFSACVGTAEYFAYTTQIASLPAAEQRSFERATAIEGKVSRDRFSAVVAMMAPGRFAGLAWAHLNQRPDRCAYLRFILDGRIFFDSEHP
ncbi:DUF6639 family protein [Roseovarius indicus]|uniref:DUF6639 family protein n=1 Tax=Roseovarius indicus TaxID=540747 RepID=UPI0032EAFDAD